MRVAMKSSQQFFIRSKPKTPFKQNKPSKHFITTCTHESIHFFGCITQGKSILSPAGKMIHDTFKNLKNYFSNLYVDHFVVMPNHIHAIIALGKDVYNRNNNKVDIIQVVKSFKSYTTNQYIKGVKEHNWPRFDKKLWQSNYYEQLIRNECALKNIRKYITDNPAKW